MEGFTLKEAEQFIKDNAVKIDTEQKKLKANDFCCVDGRVEGQNRFGIPGGAIGLLLTAEAVNDEYRLQIQRSRISELVEKTLDGMAYHTDSHAIHENKILVCAGCKHMLLALEHPDLYGISEQTAAYLKMYYLPSLTKRNINPEVLEGNHSERGVAIVNNNVALDHKNSKDQIFVYHPEQHNLALNEIADALFPDAAKINPKLKKKEFSKNFWEIAQKQLNVTLKNIADGLPHFSVFEDEKYGNIAIKAI